MLTSRERVLCALNHEEPDRVPILLWHFGGDDYAGPGLRSPEGLFGYPGGDQSVLARAAVHTDRRDVMVRFGSDGRPLIAGPCPPRGAGAFRGCPGGQLGIHWQRRPGVPYYEIIEPPLKTRHRGRPGRYPGRKWRTPPGLPGSRPKPRPSRRRAMPWWRCRA